MVAVAGQGSLTISMVKGLRGLQAIKPDWDRIHSRLENSTYHQDWRWMAALQERLIEQPIYFVVLKRGSHVVAILPLQLRKMTKAGITIDHLSFPHHSHVVLSDALVDLKQVGETDFEAILDFLEQQSEFRWDEIQLVGIERRALIREWLARCGIELEEVSSSAYFDWPEGSFDTNLSKKFIKNIRRLASKSQEECGPLCTRWVNDQRSLPAAFEEFLELEASGWKGEQGTSTAIKHSPDLVRFYRQLLDSFGEDGAFQINLLEIGGIPAAGQMCVSSQHSLFILKVAYNDDLRKYGPGNILMLNLLELLSGGSAFRELNLVTAPVWADRWHLNKRSVFAMQHFNRNVAGRLSKAMMYSRRILKDVIRAETNG